MEARAKASHLRISAQKLRLVADLVRGKNVEEALAVLDFTPKKGARFVAKALRSSVANAENNQSLDVDSLYVKKIEVGGAGMIKRFLPRAHGRATPLRKRLSHLTIVLDERTRG